MNKLKIQLIAVLTCLLLACSIGLAQGGRPGPGGRQGGRPGPPPPAFDVGGPQPGGPERRGPAPGLSFLSSEMRFSGRVVKGAPFSAESVSESTQVLADGSKISRRMTAKISRDSEGRTRREQQLNVLGPFNVAGEPPHFIFIDDPVAGAHYAINVGQKEARKFPFRPNDRPQPEPPDTSGESVESLGVQVIEGLEAKGTRSTVVIPVGQIGNDRSLNIVSELWESTELKVPVLSRHSDPRTGIIEYRLINIDRSEPAHNLFEVPPEFKLREEKPGFQRETRPRGPMRERRNPDFF